MVSFLLIALLGATPALAKDDPTLAYVGVHDGRLTPEAQRALAEQVAEVIEDTRRFEARGPEAAARAMAGREDIVAGDTYLSRGRRLLEDGRILHDQAQPEDAVPVLEQAIQALEAGSEAVDATRDLWDAHLYLGSSHMALGEQVLATRAWEGAVALSPERQPDAARIAPTVVQAYRAVQQGAQTGDLVVKTSGNASVTVNGRAIDDTLEGHPVGRVFVRARYDDGRSGFAVATVTPDETTTVELPPATLALPEIGTSTFAQAQGATSLYKALGQELGSDVIIIAGATEEDTGVIQAYAIASDTFSRPLKVALEGPMDDEVLGALPELLDALGERGTVPSIASVPTAAPVNVSDNTLLAGLLLDPQPVAPPSAGGGVKWWQVAAGGAGAILLGGGITALAVAGGSDGNRGTIIVGPVP